MPGARITTTQKETYWAAIRENASNARASRLAGFSPKTGERLLAKPSNGREYRELRKQREIPDTPIPLDEICDEAKAALADRTGQLFMRRYFGIELLPWQMESWEGEEDAWDSGDREFLLKNAAPGSGKTTGEIGFACKRIAMWRAIRILFISRAHSLAERNTMKVRRSLERSTPAVGALSTLAADFGRFKPRQGGDVWKRDEFVVEQMDGAPIEEKEPTVSAFGFDSEWIGNRLDLVIGDDLDSTRSIQNMDVVMRNREIFDNELEPRLESGGLFVMCQQRLGAFDFSAHCMSKIVLPDDDDGEGDPEGTPQYRRLTYKAHYDDRCKGSGSHKPDAAPYPEGCLLSPQKLGWRDVRKAMNNLDRFKVVYQQEDAGETDALVQKVWVDGGRGADGVHYLGCWDRERGAWEIPSGVTGLVGIVTADPSPTKYWSVQAWAVHLPSQQRYLLDLHRERMDAPDFLDWSHGLGQFTGIAEDWWHNFAKLKVPLQYVIVEQNAAQRFMLQYDHFHRWMQSRSVFLIPHSTHRNKADDNYGVQMLKPRYQHGQVRLPGKGVGRISSMRLVDEALRYPRSATTDCVMGQWFLEHAIATAGIGQVEDEDDAKPWAPSWLEGVA